MVGDSLLKWNPKRNWNDFKKVKNQSQLNFLLEFLDFFFQLNRLVKISNYDWTKLHIKAKNYICVSIENCLSLVVDYLQIIKNL